MDLQDIDIRAQTLNTSVDSVEDVLARETDAVHEAAVVTARGGDWRELALVVNAEEAFGEDDDAVAGDGVFLEGFAEDLFGDTVGVDVGLRSVSSFAS